MNIVDMLDEVVLVSNSMLPKPSLPDTAFLFAFAAFGNSLAFFDLFTKVGLNQPPATTKIIVTFRQSPNGMEMFG